jgi:hypothetical protein
MKNFSSKLGKMELGVFDPNQLQTIKKTRSSQMLTRNKSFDGLDKATQKSKLIQEQFGDLQRDLKNFDQKIKKQFSFIKKTSKSPRNSIIFSQAKIDEILKNFLDSDKTKIVELPSIMEASTDPRAWCESEKYVKKLKRDMHCFNKKE